MDGGKGARGFGANHMSSAYGEPRTNCRYWIATPGIQVVGRCF